MCSFSEPAVIQPNSAQVPVPVPVEARGSMPGVCSFVETSIPVVNPAPVTVSDVKVAGGSMPGIHVGSLTEPAITYNHPPARESKVIPGTMPGVHKAENDPSLLYGQPGMVYEKDRAALFGSMPGVMGVVDTGVSNSSFYRAAPSYVSVQSRTARIIVTDNGWGLTRSRDILESVFRAQGWEVSTTNRLDTSKLARVAINIHLETPAINLFDSAQRNALIPHPEWWSMAFNDALQHPSVTVWALTADCARVFREFGARVVQIGFQSADRHDPSVPRERSFLHVAGNAPNKGTDILARSWRPEWPKLTIVGAPELLQSIEIPSHVNVVGRVSDSDLRTLQNRHRFHVYPSRYEGFGHALWEGLSCGAVVLYSNAPPMSEIGEAGVPMAVRPGAHLGVVQGADVTSEGVVDAVEKALKLPEDWYSISRNLWETRSADFRRALVNTLELPEIVSLQSPLERCGIREYGRQLDQAFVSLGYSPRAVSIRDHGAVGSVVPGGLILVHFEPSLVTVDFAEVLAAARGRGNHVVFCCHHFEPGLINRYENAADLFVVHRSYGVTHSKLVELPLGCPLYSPPESREQAKQRLGLPADRRVIIIHGLLAPWKQISFAVSEYLKRCRPEDGFYLQILTPMLPDSGSEVELIRVVTQGRPDVLFSTEFRSEADLLDRVYASDFGFLYCPQNTGSVSAATKTYVSARTPFATNRATHTSDLQGGVVYVEGFDAGTLAQSVINVARDVEGVARLRGEMAQEYVRLNMLTTAQRYIDLFKTAKWS